MSSPFPNNSLSTSTCLSYHFSFGCLAKMRTTRAVQFTMVLSTFVEVVTSVSSTFSITVKDQFDTDGNAIDLTSGKIDFLGGQFLWYGIPFGCGSLFCGITSYSSSDLQTWKFNGLLFDPVTADNAALCAM
jgi:hypothetical protein